MSATVLQFATFIPQVVLLLVGIVLFAVRRRRIGSPATFAIIGFALHVVAYILTALSTYLITEISSGSRTSILITLNVVVTLIRIVGYVLLIVGIVRFARGVPGSAAAPAPAYGAYPPPGPAHGAYAQAPGGSQYLQASGGSPYPQQAPGGGSPYPQASGGNPYPQQVPPPAHHGQEQGELVRSAVGELNEMGRTGTLSQNGQWNPRVRELGQLLDRSGGMYSMKEAHMQFSRAFPHLSRELDVAWIAIGNWQS